MRCRVAYACVVAVLVAGCASSPSQGVADAEGALIADGFPVKSSVARESCRAAGWAEQTAGLARCIAAREAAYTARLKAVCLDPVRFELGHCIEI